MEKHGKWKIRWFLKNYIVLNLKMGLGLRYMKITYST